MISGAEIGERLVDHRGKNPRERAVPAPGFAESQLQRLVVEVRKRMDAQQGVESGQVAIGGFDSDWMIRRRAPMPPRFEFHQSGEIHLNGDG